MKIKKYLLIILISIFVAGGLFFYLVKAEVLPIRMAASTATLSVVSSDTNYKVGDTFTADIILNTGGTEVDGADIFYLNYSPSLLSVQDADSGTPGVQITKGEIFNVYAGNSVDTNSGKISIAGLVTPGGTPFNGTGKVATITFKVLATGDASVRFDFVPGSTTDCNVAEHSTGNDILESVVNGAYTLGQPAAIPQVSLEANNQDSSVRINYGTGITLNWAATDADTCIASGDWDGAKEVSGSESFDNLTSSKTYTLTCTNDGGSNSDSVIVSVVPLDENGKPPTIIDEIINEIKAAPTGASVSIGLVVLLILLSIFSIVYLRKKVKPNSDQNNLK